MDKKQIVKYFEEDDKNLVISLYERYELALDKNITVFGNSFYSPNIWTFFKSNFESKNFTINSNGFFNEAERRMICFNNIYNNSFPYKVLKIRNTSKFNKISHRDYLGAMLALGINRNKMGDLLVKDNCCYVPVCDEIVDFILSNLNTVGKVSCQVTIIDNISDIPEFEFKEEIILIQSLRLDAVISKLTKLSRSKAQSMIDEGKILIDYNRCRDKSTDVNIGTRITIRGTGKFIISEIIGNSKSGKLKILVKKYT